MSLYGGHIQHVQEFLRIEGMAMVCVELPHGEWWRVCVEMKMISEKDEEKMRKWREWERKGKVTATKCNKILLRSALISYVCRIKEAIVKITGEGSFGMLRTESGVHVGFFPSFIPQFHTFS